MTGQTLGSIKRSSLDRIQTFAEFKKLLTNKLDVTEKQFNSRFTQPQKIGVEVKKDT